MYLKIGEICYFRAIEGRSYECSRMLPEITVLGENTSIQKRRTDITPYRSYTEVAEFCCRYSSDILWPRLEPSFQRYPHIACGVEHTSASAGQERLLY